MKKEEKNRRQLSLTEKYDQLENKGLDHWLAYLNDAIPYSELVKESRLAVRAASEKRHHELIREQLEIIRARMGVKQLPGPAE